MIEPPVVFLLGLAGLGGVLLYGFGIFDRLMWNQYEFHRESWIADGKPQGIFWRSPEARTLSGYLRTNLVSLRYLFKTPDWIRDSANMQALLKRYRYAVAIWNVGAIALLVVHLNQV